ncbi:TIGR04438 family Trp-rich protein [Glaciimonas sp. PAMC28666]|uniref:TIGR04438 family Trp-rich protein n=1 Tax=Glaciimonas sp. PAMC28666 TaxID=2807626 RepID=UPI001964B889|nr:TIGR04438 family Trp-rich protein [Glaciimonas sp. PAMC28666]QRX81135.1 TIGR04438 family Trp-rich protein [Glaciimonas sp. PAMC28666]
MLLIIVIVVLVALKYFAIGPFADISWWWAAGLMAIAFVWFEFVERIIGFDKRRAHDQMDKVRKDRVDKIFGTKKGPKR